MSKPTGCDPMELNTSLRIASSTAFDKKFYKAINNLAFAKTCETKKNRDQVVFARNAQRALQRTQNFHFKLLKIFRESLAEIKIAKNWINWNKPTIAGANVLDLPNLPLLQFYYTVMMPKFD